MGRAAVRDRRLWCIVSGSHKVCIETELGFEADGAKVLIINILFFGIGLAMIRV